MKNIVKNLTAKELNLTTENAKEFSQSPQSLNSLRTLCCSPFVNFVVKNMRFLYFIIFAVTLISCNEKKAVEPQEEESSQTEVALNESQYKTVGIETGFVENRNLNKVIKANGYMTVPPQNSAEVSTLIGGTVKDIFVLEGTYVNKGKVCAL